MADLSFTANDVRLVSGFAITGVCAVAIAQGNLIYLDENTGEWLLSTDDMPRAQYGIALSAGAAGQTIAIVSQPGSVVYLGDAVLNEGDLMVASAATSGKLAPYADLDIPGGDTLFIVGEANAQRLLVVKLSYTGITAMPTNEGAASVTVGGLTLEASTGVLNEGAANVTVGGLTTVATGEVPRSGVVDVTIGGLTASASITVSAGI